MILGEATGAAPSGRKPAVLARGTARAARAGEVKFKLKPTPAARRALRRKRSLRASAKVSFTPGAAGPLSSQTRAIKLKRAKKKR